MTTLKSRIGKYIIPRLPFNRRTFNILRHEMRAARTRILNSINPFYYLHVAELKSRKELFLNIGSGGKGLEGWVNVELLRAQDTTLCLDVRRKLPLSDGSVKWIFVEHVVEHVDFCDDLPRMLADWWRVLDRGGVVRIVVPDVERFIAAYASADEELWRALGWDICHMPEDIYTPMHILNHVFHQEGEHLFGFDFDTLSSVLKRAGFSRVSKQSYRESVASGLAIDQEHHAHYSLYVDAVK